MTSLRCLQAVQRAQLAELAANNKLQENEVLRRGLLTQDQARAA